MTSDEWRAAGGFFHFQNHKIFYRTGGARAGETLLCLHGFPTCSFDYRKIWNALAAHFNVVAFDLIGYGFSAKPPAFAYTTFNQTDVLEQLLAQLNVRKIHILAHDYGNTITQELLARQTENRLKFDIKTICFLNGALFPETHRPIAAQKLLAGPLGFLLAELIPDRLFKKSLASVFGAQTQPTRAELNEYLHLFKLGGGKKIAHKLIKYMSERAAYRSRWVGALERMRQPFRFINGSADQISGAHLVARFREILPAQTDIIELAGVGHFPHLEVPDAVTRAFLDFHGKNQQ